MRALSLALAALIAACSAPPPGARAELSAGAQDGTSPPPPPDFFQTDAPAPRNTEAYQVQTVATGLEHPWAVAFLPDGRFLVTERPGRLRIVSADGKLSAPLPGVPEVWAQGQGGLLDVVLGPTFARDSTIYFTYAEPRQGGTGTAVARAVLVDSLSPRLDKVQVIFRQTPTYESRGHFGSRLAFAADGKLFVTLGERMTAKERAQDLTYHFGKVVRINPDGSVPADNPFVGRKDAKPEIWSYGHRNPQSAAINPADGRLWTVEHGARGGDELNVPLAGRNYGWPVITHGVDYSGLPVGSGQNQAPDMEQPKYYWVPSIAPSGMAFYTGSRFPAWKGDLFVGALAGQHVSRLDLENGKVAGEEKIAENLGRVRDVRQGPDGYLYLVTDEEDGKLLRIAPKR